MKIAIIGAGFTGLSAAFELLKKGHEVTILEKDAQPGGLAIGYQEKGWEWTLESFYHHWFTNDAAILGLAKEIAYPVIVKRPKTSSLIEKKIYQLDSPRTLLAFQKLSIGERLRMATVLAFLRFDPLWKPLEKITATKFLSKTIGTKAYTILWKPLLVGKFGKYVNEISLAWFWARIVKRTTFLAYPQEGFLAFAQYFAKEIEKKGGKIIYNASVDQITSMESPTIQYKTPTAADQLLTADKVIVTLPSFALIKLAPTLPEGYKENLMKLKGLGAVMLVLRLKKQFLEDGTYWLNICDTTFPVLAIVEHTNFMDPQHYNNEHLVYLGNYLPHDHPYFSKTAEELMAIFDPYLSTLHPGYKKDIIGFTKFSVPFAQPIIPTNYSKLIPPFDTPLKEVYLANMQQVYPWDRGTNYAVELGQKISSHIMRGN